MLRSLADPAEDQGVKGAVRLDWGIGRGSRIAGWALSASIAASLGALQEGCVIAARTGLEVAQGVGELAAGLPFATARGFSEARGGEEP